MLVTMKRRVFDSLDLTALAWACIEPTLQQMRGQGVVGKSQISQQLTTGQRALLMFKVLYGHTADGIAQFYELIPYLPGQRLIWSELKTGMRYFGDHAMLQLVEQMEAVYLAFEAQYQQDGAAWPNGHSDEDARLQAAVEPLDTLFKKVTPIALNHIGAYIRTYPGEFVQFEELYSSRTNG